MRNKHRLKKSDRFCLCVEVRHSRPQRGNLVSVPVCQNDPHIWRDPIRSIMFGMQSTNAALDFLSLPLYYVFVFRDPTCVL